jgi:uncharacterized integral membrane protein
MCVVYLIILVLLVAAAAVFAVQIAAAVDLRFMDRSVGVPLSLLIGVVYVLGMVTGWTVAGFLKRSMQRITERREE